MAAYCGARKRQGEGTCKRPAGWGTDHFGVGRCKLHGGSTRDQSLNAAKEQARAELARIGVAPVTDPLAALSAIAGEVVAWKDMLAGKVNALTSLRYETEVGGEQLRAEVALWERALDRCGKFLVDIAKLNIEERMAKVTEAQAAMVADALSATLREMGLPADKQQEAQARLGRHLRAVS